MSTYRGDTIVEGQATYTTNTDGSGTTTRYFEGQETDVRNMADSLIIAGYQTTLEQGPTWKLTATLSYNILDDTTEQEPEAQWTITPNSGEQNILESDILPVTLSTNTKELIMLAVKNQGKGYYSKIHDMPAGDERDLAIVLYSYMAAGADSRRFNTVSVSRTVTVSKTFVSTWDLQYTNYVLSKATLTTSTNMPNWVSVLLPASAENVTTNGGLVINRGYLQEHPSYQNVSNNQVQISQTWQYNDWIADYYYFV